VTIKTLPSRLGRLSGLKDMMYKSEVEVDTLVGSIGRWREISEDDVQVIVLSC